MCSHLKGKNPCLSYQTSQNFLESHTSKSGLLGRGYATSVCVTIYDYIAPLPHSTACDLPSIKEKDYYY